MEKVGKVNAWEAATRAESFSKALQPLVGFVPAALAPNTLTACQTASCNQNTICSQQAYDWNTLSYCANSLQLKMLLRMRHCPGTFSSLTFPFLAYKYHWHVLLSQQRVPTAPFLPDLKRVFTSASKGTVQHQWEGRHWELSLVTPVVKQPILQGEKGQQQEAGKQNITLQGSFSSEKHPHLKICFSEQTWLSLTTECCCFVRASSGHSEKRLTSPYSYPASPPPCLFWPIFQTFSRFLSLTQTEFSMSERGTSPWEQLLENKPPNKANLHNEVKWCLNYYKYYPGYNRAEFICPFVTMKQTPRNASQEFLSLLNPPFSAIPWPGSWEKFPASAGKLPSWRGILFSSSKDSSTLKH